MSWMIENWIKNHLVTLQIYNVQVLLQGMTNNVRFTLSNGDPTRVVSN